MRAVRGLARVRRRRLISSGRGASADGTVGRRARAGTARLAENGAAFVARRRGRGGETAARAFDRTRVARARRRPLEKAVDRRVVRQVGVAAARRRHRPRVRVEAARLRPCEAETVARSAEADQIPDDVRLIPYPPPPQRRPPKSPTEPTTRVRRTLTQRGWGSTASA